MKSMYRIAAIMLFAQVLFTAVSSAEVRCVDTIGEAVIRNNDVSSAKEEAIARAKWNAIEKVAGVEIRSESVVQNMRFVDEMIIKTKKGAVDEFRILKEETLNDIIKITANVCVEPSMAKDAFGSLVPNRSIFVVIAMKEGRKALPIVSTMIKDKLHGSGLTVVEGLSQSKAASRTPLARFALHGEVDYTILSKEGDLIGYGIEIPFMAMKIRMTYRLIARSGDDNAGLVLAAGTEEGKGFGIGKEDALYDGMKDLAENVTVALSENISRHIKGLSKRVNVHVEGVLSLADHFMVKEMLNHIAWVTEVDENGIGDFTVTYAENPIYLANSINQKERFKVKGYSARKINVIYN